MNVLCPVCQKSVRTGHARRCRHCGCEVAILRKIHESAQESILLALKSLRIGHDAIAHDFAHESWGLRRSRQAAAIGLLAAVALADPVEIPRWMRRRRSMLQAE